MSSNYNDRLRPLHHKGLCGDPEKYDNETVLDQKCKLLAEWIKQAECNSIVAFTGAGVSTSCGIPDFRGPTGVWTMEKKLKKEAAERKRKKRRLQEEPSCESNGLPEKPSDDSNPSTLTSVGFEQAIPSFTHMSLVALQNQKKLLRVISQNVDGLHLKSGIERSRLSELHGNVFAEYCNECKREYIRNKDVGGMGCRPTGEFQPFYPSCFTYILYYFE
jgi:mono-ADP-ribosyltransferase sirtuin 6